MANVRSTVWYINFGNGTSTGYYAVSQWAVATYTVGQLVIPKTAPAVGNERVYVCTKAGLSVGEPSWTFAKGAKQTDSSTGVETFQECTGQPGVCGDGTNVPIWTTSSTWTLGQIITNIAGTGWFICATAGTQAGGVSSQPAGLTTPVLGVTTTDASTTWTCIATASLGGPSNTGGPYGKFNAPHARLANAVAANWGAAGDTFYVGDNHAETQSTAITITFPGTTALPNYVYCVDHAGTIPPGGSNLKTSGTISTTGASNLTVGGAAYCYGTALSAGSAGNTANILVNNAASSVTIQFDACGLILGNTGSTSVIALGTTSNVASSFIGLNNTTVKFGATTQSINKNLGFLRWTNTPAAINSGGSVPTILLKGNVYDGRSILDGLDLSALGSGTTLIGAAGTGAVYYQVLNCKLGASVIVSSTPTSPEAGITDLIISDSSGTGYRQERYAYAGTLTASATVYNNASDGDTPISWQVVATANANRAFPFECFDIVQWVAAGTFAASLVQITSATASLLSSDVWVETEYLGNASFPISSLVSSAPANLLTAGSSLAAGTWAHGSLGHDYQLAIPSFTTALDGYVRFKVKVAKASLTVNIDPKVTVA